MGDGRRWPHRWAYAAAAVLLLLATVLTALALRPRGPVVPSLAPGAAAAVDFIGLHGTRVHFASVAEARALLAVQDDWMRATGELQRAALMERAPPAGMDEFARWQSDAVLPWTTAQQAHWQAVLERLAPALNRLGLPWPPMITLVHSTGRESAATPHTRGAAIVLPDRADLQGFTDADLLAHELFHVLSRHDPALADRVYAQLGFEPVGELQWPAPWARMRIADQDAPHLRHAMRVRIAGVTHWVMPVVVAAKEQPDRSRGETLEHLMQTRLLDVLPGRGGAPSRAVTDANGPVWFRVEDVPDFLERLGGNTDYVLHPEETSADNFMLLVTGRAAPNPALLQRIGRALGNVKESGASSAPG